MTEFQNEMEENLNELVEKYTAIAEEWKTGLMNQYLLNEEVSIYDWANGESRCIGWVHIGFPRAIHVHRGLEQPSRTVTALPEFRGHVFPSQKSFPRFGVYSCPSRNPQK